DAQPVAGLGGGGPPARLWRAFMVAALPRAGATAIPPGPAPTVLTPPLPQTILVSAPPRPLPPPATPTPARSGPLDQALDALLNSGQTHPYNPATDPPF
ncbi:MAG TPA: hypothetical protein VIJ94_07375, partial [Caulobacteraceae bacterium]